MLNDLGGDVLHAIGKACRWRRYGAGQEIIGYHDTSTDVYFLTEGRVRVIIYSVEGKAVSFRDIAEGDLFGEFAAIDGRPRSASIEALTDCCVAILDARTFRDLLLAHSELAAALLRHVTAEVRRLTAALYEFGTLAVQNRIQAELVRLAQDRSSDGKQAVLAPAPIHRDIASRVITHREAVSREMSRLAKLGILRRNGNALHILDLPRLRRMVHEASGE